MIKTIWHCRSCKYYHEAGECRRYAPRPHSVDVEGVVICDTWWPDVSSSDWCGEYLFKPRTDEE